VCLRSCLIAHCVRCDRSFHPPARVKPDSPFAMNVLCCKLCLSFELVIRNFNPNTGGDMSVASPAPQQYPRLQRLIEWLTYAYLIRFPLLTAAALVGIPYAAFFTGARSLLENLFDLDPGAIMLVTMIALLSAWSVMVTARLVLTYSN